MIELYNELILSSASTKWTVHFDVQDMVSCGNTKHSAHHTRVDWVGWHSCAPTVFHTPLHASHTHTCRAFNSPFFSGTTQVSRYQKGKISLDYTEAKDSEWQWHQLGHMQVCTSLQTDNHASTPPLTLSTAKQKWQRKTQRKMPHIGENIEHVITNMT